jgi:hypothetical protein
VHKSVSILNKKMYFIAEYDADGSVIDIHKQNSLNASQILEHNTISETEGLAIINQFLSIKKNRKYNAYCLIVGAINTREEQTKIDLAMLPVS